MSAAADSNPPGELYCTTCEKTYHVGDRCPVDGTRLLRLKAHIDPFLGRDLGGDYTVLEKLGQGGMGSVYRALQNKVNREVAIKVVNAALISDNEVIKRFLREAKIATQLSHPNVVTLLEYDQTDDGLIYLVMELVKGRTLDNVIKAERVFRPERVVRIGTQILDALDGAHSLSIVHRDLKPSNVMLLSQGRDLVKVLDFGLAKSVSPDATSTTMTGAGVVVGTPAFMPPELAMGVQCDHRADLYSLGVMLYLMGSGRLPFVSESIHELVAMHGSDEPAPPMTGVPHRMARVIDKMLEKDPDKRFQTAADALSALESSLVIMTPASGISVIDGGETNPSLGPFPASSSQFAHLAETPLPPSLISADKGDRKRPTQTEEQRIAGGATMLASSSAPPVAAQSQHSLTTTAIAPRSKLPLIGGIVGAIGVAVVAFVLVSGGESPAPAKPVTETPTEPAKSVAPPVEPPPESKPAAAPPPPVETKPEVAETTPADPPPAAKTPDKKKPKTKTKTTATTTKTEPVQQPEQKPPTKTEPKSGAAMPF